MTNMLNPILCVIILALTGCINDTQPAIVDETDPCGALGHTGFLGSNIAAVTLPAALTHRVVGPNDAVTMDYLPDRLNIETDADGLIIGLSCG